MKQWLVGPLLCGLAFASGCLKPTAVACDETGSWVCPASTVCDLAHHLCVAPGQLDACRDQADHVACGPDETTGIPRFCSSGVCLAQVCGDGFLVGPETCDDSNAANGDGCSAVCADERCGNGVIDPVRGDAQGHPVANEECDDGGFLDHDGCSSTCKRETPRWTRHYVSVEARGWPAMAYDTHRDRIVAFGGDLYPRTGSAARFSADTLEWNGRDWSVLDVPGPPGRFAAGMVYDSDRRQIVLFGGEVAFNHYLSDMWRWDGVTWTQVVLPAGASVPPARSRATMAYDPKRKVLVLYGGKSFEDGLVKMRADTWEWNGTAWTEIDGDSPPGGREHAAVAYDPAMGGVVIAGGDTYTALLGDTWLYRDQTWQQLASTLAPATPTLTGFGMAYDLAGQRLVAFGGNTTPGNSLGVTPQSSTMVWNGTGWSTLATTVPSARSDVALGANRHQVVAFGGRTSNVAGPTDTLLLRADSGWSAPAALGLRFAMVAANLPARASAVIFGGQTAGGIANTTGETFELTYGDFVSRGATGPSTRSFSAAAYDPVHRNVVLFGGTGYPPGTTTSVRWADTWTWDGDWTQVSVAQPPPGRDSAQLAFDGQQVVLLGGGDYVGANRTLFTDAWGWTGSAWSALSFMPPGRENGAAGFDPIGDQLVGYGGRIMGANESNDTFTVKAGAYSPYVSAPVANRGSSLVWNPARQRLTLLGGVTESSTNAYELDPAAGRWVPVPVTSAPPGRTYAAVLASIDGSGLLVMGGSVFGAGLLDDIWELSWQGPGLSEQCGATDLDGDGLLRCDDPDCWWVCAPACPPGTEATCDAQAPRCGDGTCDGGRERCSTCPGDCGACNVCGDGVCDAGETCAGDCP